MTNDQLVAAQAESRSRHPKRSPRAKTHGSSPEGRAEQKAWLSTQPPQDKVFHRTPDEAVSERTAKQELKGAMHKTRQQIRRRAGVQRRVYRGRKLRFAEWKLEIKLAWRLVLQDWESLRAEMRECKATLKRLRVRAEVQRALGQSEGFQLGREAALKEIADQQSGKGN